MKGAGNDIWDAKDEFHFLFRDEPFEGDFAVSARVSPGARSAPVGVSVTEDAVAPGPA